LKYRWLLASLLLGVLLVPALHTRSVSALNNCSAGTGNDSEELNFLGIINDYRTSNGLGTLSISANLNRAARWKVNDMGGHNYFSHTDSLGRSPWTLTVDCGYPVAGGENLAAGTYRSTASSAFELFRNSPSHNENMLLASYRQIGIARVYVPGSTYGWYWATEFGTTNDNGSPAAPAQAAAAASNSRAQAAPAAAAAAAPAKPVIPTAALTEGLTDLTWQGPVKSPGDAMSPASEQVIAVFSCNPETGYCAHYLPGLPPMFNDLDRLETGHSYWVISGGPATLPMQ